VISKKEISFMHQISSRANPRWPNWSTDENKTQKFNYSEQISGEKNKK